MRAAVAVLIASVVSTAMLTRPPRLLLNTEGSIPDARVVRMLARSHLSLVADLYWIRMGSLGIKTNVPADGKYLIAWGQFVTDLDPTLFWAYAMGGLLGGMRFDRDVYNGKEAAALLEKGTHQVDDPRLFIYLAYTQLDLLNDKKGAALTLQRGSKLKTAPAYFAPLATRLLAQTGDFDAARAFASQLAQSEDPVTREAFTLRLKEIDRENVLVQVDDAVARFKAERGALPASVEALVPGYLTTAPVDPLGGVIALDAKGRAQASSGSRLQLFVPAGEQPFDE